MIYKNKEYYITIILYVISNLFTTSLIFLNSKLADAAISLDFKLFIKLVIVEILAMLLVSLLSYLTERMQNKYLYIFTKKTRRKFLWDSIKYENFYEDDSEKKSLSKLTNDVDYIVNNGVRQYFVRINSFLSIIFPLIAASIIHISFLVVFPLSAAISILIVKKASSFIDILSRQRSEENSNFVNSLTDILSGFQTLKLFGADSFLIKKFDFKQDKFENKKLNLENKISFYKSLIMIAMVFSQLIYIFNSGYLVYIRSISPGKIIGLMGVAQSFYSNINTCLSTSLYISSVKPIIEDMKLDKKKKKIGEKIEADIKDIRIENLSFYYDDKKIFDNFSLEFDIGKKYLIKGKSGKGKSTLLKIMTKQITDYTGYVYYGENDLAKINQKDLLGKIAYISQDVHIFNDTLEKNISLNDEIDSDKLNYSLEFVKLKEEINPKDFISPSTISGGQKQKVAIARAVYYDKEFWFLDEAIKAIDRNTADQIEKNILNLKDKTVFNISHRDISEENKYDKIIKL